MIDPQTDPVVLDFGLARDVAADGASITRSGDAFGTLAYMSPEQLSGEGELDRRTDVYSLAVTLYECADAAAARRGGDARVAPQGHPLGRPRGRVAA